MNYLQKRLPKDIMYIILDYAKDIDLFNKVMSEFEYKIRQVKYNVPKDICLDYWGIRGYMNDQEFINYLCTSKNGSQHLIKSTLKNEKFYYFG